MKALKLEECQELKSIEGLFSKTMQSNEIKNETDEIKRIEKKINRKDLIYKAGKYKYDIQQYETIRSFAESIYTGKTNIDEGETDQTNLLKNILNFNNKSKAKVKEGKD